MDPGREAEGAKDDWERVRDASMLTTGIGDVDTGFGLGVRRRAGRAARNVERGTRRRLVRCVTVACRRGEGGLV